MEMSEADALGRTLIDNYLRTIELLLSNGRFDTVRAIILTTLPYVLANSKPDSRVIMMVDMLETYSQIGKEVYEDAKDLYDHLMKREEYDEE